MRQLFFSLCLCVLFVPHLAGATIVELVGNPAATPVETIPVKDTGDAFSADEFNTIIDLLRGLSHDDNGTFADQTDDHWGFGGILNPSETVHVNGNVRATSYLGDGSQLTGIDKFWAQTGSAINYPTGSVGIGVASPSALLHVAGEVIVDGISVGQGGGDNSLNTALGLNALSANTTGEDNTALGSTALLANTEGSANTAVGQEALESNTTGNSNTAVGVSALQDNTAGSGNLALGQVALESNTTGGGNTAVGGFDSMRYNTTGNHNIAVGQAMSANTTGSNNIAIGRLALWDMNITDGSDSYNIAIGSGAGRGILTGVNNTILGSQIGTLPATLSNTVIIADGSGNKRIYIDSAGEMGVGTTTPGYELDVAGDVNFTGNLYQNGTLANFSGKFQDGTTAGEIYYNGGNVGIGTVNPSSALEVQGLIRAGTATSTAGSVAFANHYNGSQGDYINIFGSQYSSGATVIGYAAKPKVGATGYVSAADNVSWRRGVAQLDGNFRVLLGAAQSVAVDSDVSLQERFTILQGGAVGIGNLSPSYKLDINDDAATGAGLRVTGGGGGQPLAVFQRDVGGSGSMVMSSSNNDPQMYFNNSAGGNIFSLGVDGTSFKVSDNTTIGTNDRLVIDSAGEVGIGVAAPAYDLDVAGDINLTGDIYQNGVLADFGGGKFVDGTNAADAVYTAGNVGIGTTDPDEELEVVSDRPVLRMNDTDGAYADFVYNAGTAFVQVDPGNAEASSRFQVNIDNVQELRVNADGVDISDSLAAGPNAVVMPNGTLNLDEHYDVDSTTYQLYSSTSITSPALTADRISYGAFMDLVNNKTESGSFDSDGYGGYFRTRTTGTNTWRNNYGIYGAVQSTSAAATDQGNLYAVYGLAQHAGDAGNVTNVRGITGLAYGDTTAASTGTITESVAMYGVSAAYESNTTRAYGGLFQAQTANGDDGDIATAYGVRGRVYQASAAGGDITTAYAGYFDTSHRSTGPVISTATGVYSDVDGATTAYGAQIYANDSDATDNYGIYVDASNASGNNIGIYGFKGDWLLADTAAQVGLRDTTPDSDLTLDVNGKIGADQICNEDGGNCVDVDTLSTAGADNLGNHIGTQTLTLDGYSLFLERPLTSSGWARGLMHMSDDGATTLGGFGMLGNNTTVTNMHMAHGATPYNSGLGVYVVPNGQVGIGTTAPVTNANSAMTVDGWISRTAHNNGGLVGSYNNIGANGANTNPIYTIGTSYLPAATALTNMYGVGYANGTLASFLSTLGGGGWGMYVAADGDARIFLDGQYGRIRTTGGMYIDDIQIASDGAYLIGDRIQQNSIDASEIQDGTLTAADTNTSSIQSRVTGTCATGSSIRAIAANGTVTCEADDSGSGGDDLGNHTATTTLDMAQNTISAAGVLDMNQSGTYDVWIQGEGVGGTTRNLAMLGVKSSDLLHLNYNGEYSGGVHIGVNSTGVAISNAGLVDADGGYSVDGTTVINGTGGIIGDQIVDGSVDNTEIQDGTLTAADTNTSSIQSRVTGTCATGSSIRAIAANGTVTCEADDSGSGGDDLGNHTATQALAMGNYKITGLGTPTAGTDAATKTYVDGFVTGVTAGTGLSGGGTSGTVTVSANTTYLQRRVSGTCAAGSSIRAISATGTVTCETDDSGSGSDNLGNHTATTNLSMADFEVRNVRELELKDYDDNTGGADNKYRLLARDGAHQFYNGGVVVGSYANGTWSDLADGYLVVEGRAAIGKTTANYPLDVSGTARATAFLYDSDARLKENLTSVGNAEDVLSIGTYRYNWKDSGSADIGVIAQEVEEVFPEFVSTDDAGYKSVDYARMVVPLLEVVKQQEARIEALEQRIEDIKQ